MTPAVWIEGPAVVAPGLLGWAQARAVLRGEACYEPIELPKYAPNLLPPNERRRATNVCRLAFQAAEEAIQSTSSAPAELAAVFASSGGDTDVLSLLCSALATAERQISPTHFHNSVHNAPAGYWSIATHARGPSTSLSAFDATFAAGLLEAATLCASEQRAVLLVAYDIVPVPPLHAKRPLLAPMGVAFVLQPRATASAQAKIQMTLHQAEPDSVIEQAELERLRTGNPAARALPLLAALARRQSGRLSFSGVPGTSLAVEVAQC